MTPLVADLSTTSGINLLNQIPRGRKIAEKINIFQRRDRSPGCSFQCLESKAPPNTSAHITIGIKNGIGNTHIKRGVIMSAPPNPLSLLMKPPKNAANINRQIEARFSRIKQPH
jgi:hypothetical protein